MSPENVPMWEPNPDPYTVEVQDPEKKKKYHGIKSFIAYSVKPSVCTVHLWHAVHLFAVTNYYNALKA